MVSGYLNRAAILAGLLGALLLGSALPTFHGARPAWAGSALPSGYESYTSRPDILTLKPKAHPELGKGWEKLKRGHVEMVAMLLEMYPDRELYFLARDSELLYDLARIVTKDDPARKQRIHMLNVSRANMRSEHLSKYLAQEGISEAALREGKKVMFVDTGFAGTIPKVISEAFPEELRPQLQTHLICSANPKHPSSRVFLSAVNPAAPLLDPGDLHASIIDYEYMPRYTKRSDQFLLHDGRFHPVTSVATSPDGIQSRQKSLQYMEDLLQFASHADTKALLEKRRLQWRRLRELTLTKGQDDVARELKAIINSDPFDPFLESMVRDFLEMNEKTLLSPVAGKISLDELGLPEAEIAKNFGNNKLQILHKYPEWVPYLEDPHTGIQKLIDLGDYATLGALADVVTYDDFTNALCVKLEQNPLTTEAKRFIKAIIESGKPEILKTLGTHTFSQPSVLKMPELLTMLVEKAQGEAQGNLAMWVFAKPHAGPLKEPLKLLIDQAEPFTLMMLASNVFSMPHTAAMGDLLERLIGRMEPKDLHFVAKFVFSQPHAADKEALLLKLIEGGDDVTRLQIAQSVFSQPHSANWGRALELLLSKGPPEVGWRLARFAFSRPHLAAREDVLLKIMENGDRVVLREVASKVLSQPHSGSLKKVWLEVAKWGDESVHETLIEEALMHPHSPNRPAVVSILAEQGSPKVLALLTQKIFAFEWAKGMDSAFGVLIRRADDTVLEMAIMDVFSKPHSVRYRQALELAILRASPNSLRMLREHILILPHFKGTEFDRLRAAVQLTKAFERKAFFDSHVRGAAASDRGRRSRCIENAVRRSISR